MSTQTWLRDVRRLLDSMGVEHAFEFGRKHCKVFISANGHKGLLILSMSPSDRNSIYSVQRMVRRELKLAHNTQQA